MVELMVSIFKTQCCFSLLVWSEEREGKREKEERKRERQMQHMISTWGCRNSEFISKTHWRNQTREREGEQRAQKERESKKRRKRNRGRGRGREGREKGKSKKRQRVRERERGEREWSQEQTLHVAVEGVIWLWRGTNSQVRQTLRKLPAQMRTSFSPEWKTKCSFSFFSQLFYCDRVSFLWEPASIFPSMVFSTLSFCPVCWLHVFFGVWSWRAGSSAGFVQQLSGPVFSLSVFICSVPVNVCRFYCLCLCPPSPPLLSHCFLLNFFVFTGCRLVTVSFLFLSPSVCLSPF